MPYKDPDKQRAAWRAYYRRNPALHHAIRKAKRQQMIDWFVNLKSAYSCVICGESDSACIEFHHRDGETKDFNVSDFVAPGYGKSRILEEISKCIALCANCHRKVHAGRIDTTTQLAPAGSPPEAN